MQNLRGVGLKKSRFKKKKNQGYIADLSPIYPDISLIFYDYFDFFCPHAHVQIKLDLSTIFWLTIDISAIYRRYSRFSGDISIDRLSVPNFALNLADISDIFIFAFR